MALDNDPQALGSPGGMAIGGALSAPPPPPPPPLPPTEPPEADTSQDASSQAIGAPPAPTPAPAPPGPPPEVSYIDTPTGTQSYKTPTPLAALGREHDESTQPEQDIIAQAPPPISLKGSAGGSGALGSPQLVDHEPRLPVPVGRYKQLEKDQPTLFEAVNHVADDVGIPRLDLAALVYANSDDNPNARDGNRLGYMGITPDDARRYDPNGHLDPTNPIQNLYLGALKYKQLSEEYGRGTADVFAAYHAGGDVVNAMQRRDPADHESVAPHGTFDFINRVVGREPNNPTGDRAQQVQAAPAPAPVGDTVDMQRLLNDPAYRAQVIPDVTSPGAALKPSALPAQMPVVTPLTQGLMTSNAAEEAAARGVPLKQVVEERMAKEPPAEAPSPPTVIPPAAIGAATGNLVAGGTPPTPPAPAAAPAPASVMGQPTAIGALPDVKQDLGSSQPTPPAPGPAATPPDQHPAGPPQNRVMFGDSYAAGGVQAGLPGSEAPKDNPSAAGTSRVGAPTGEVLRRINDAPDDQVQGKDVTLSTGILNGGNMGDVRRQIDALLAKGARSVTVLGTPNNDRWGDLNDGLSNIVDAYDGDDKTQGRVSFLGPVNNVAPDGVHPADIRNYLGMGGSGTTGSQPTIPTPGATPAAPTSASSSAPIDRLSGRPSQMTPQGVIRADVAGGPNGVLTYMSHNGRAGATVGQNWDQIGALMEAAMIAKGDPVGAQHAREYVFQMQHQGAVQSLTQAYNAFQAGDLQGAAQLLARSHAFANDGAALGFQVVGNRMFGQRFSEDTHQPLGQAFEINPVGIRSMINMSMNPQQFLQTVNEERKTNETIAHNRALEQHETAALAETTSYHIADVAMRERLAQAQIEGQWQRLQTRDADAKERLLAGVAARQQVMSAGRINQITKDANTYYDPETGQATDLSGQPMAPAMRNDAQGIAIGLQQFNAVSNNKAYEIARNLVAPKFNADGTPNAKLQYYIRPAQGSDSRTIFDKDGQAIFDVRDLKGNHVAYLPEKFVTPVAPEVVRNVHSVSGLPPVVPQPAMATP
jgi:hypothetical protein